MTHLTYLEAAVVGLVQGISEMFPISSLGHNVLLPALVGGSWARNLNVAAPESPYLAFIVGLHVATAIALLVYFWRDWVRIIGGFFTSVYHMRVRTRDEKLAWMIVLATIPVGITGLLFEHEFRVIFGTPIYAGFFMMVNGLVLIGVERFRRPASLAADAALAGAPAPAGAGMAGTGAAGTGAAGTGHAVPHLPVAAATRLPGVGEEGERLAPAPAASVLALDPADPRVTVDADQRLAAMSYARAVVIGSAQILALLAGISRDGITMAAGMTRGLGRADAARFAFLLATPVIFAAGALKIPDLLGPLGKGIQGPILLGSLLSGLGAYVSIRFLLRYLRTRTLTPFGWYCLAAGLASVIYLGVVR